MNNDDCVSALTDSSRFWPEKYYKSHDSVLQQRSDRQHQHFMRHYQQKILELYRRLEDSKRSEQQAILATALRLSQPFEQAVDALKEKSLAFDALMQRFDQLSQERLTPAIYQAQINRQQGASPEIVALMANIEKLIQTYAKQYLVTPPWQTVVDRLSITPIQTMARQHSSFLDFRHQCQMIAKMATRECQRDTWRLHNLVLALTTLIEQLENVNQTNLLRIASPLPTQSTLLASTSGLIRNKPPVALQLKPDVAMHPCLH